MSEQQKEYYLREKMRAIQEELGDKAKKDSDVEKLRESIKKAGLPKSMEEKGQGPRDLPSVLITAYQLRSAHIVVHQGCGGHAQHVHRYLLRSGHTTSHSIRHPAGKGVLPGGHHLLRGEISVDQSF